jgi:trehalose synthase
VASSQLNAVELGEARLERYRPLLEPASWTELERTMARAAGQLRGHVVWNVNSTARGGGVAEMLAALIPYDRGAGIDARWVVIQGPPEFFEVTKKLHTLLHGVDPDGRGGFTAGDSKVYEDALAANATALRELVRPGDVVLLHDPQSAGLAPALTTAGCVVIWRCHIGVDVPNDAARAGWRFLREYVASAAALVFSRRQYVWEGLEPARARVIPPSIDAFAVKNQDLDEPTVIGLLRAGGVLSGADGKATFVRTDGTSAHVSRRVTGLPEGGLAPDTRLVVQVSRWDRLKDPLGVMEAFAAHVAGSSDAHLLLAGPAATSVTDDPEQPEMLSELSTRRDALPEAVRSRVHLTELPMEDDEENAALVNALQRRADVVVQKSLAEGFGLTVAEAMWKARPVVASRVGGIEDQVEDGESGLLIDDPRDLRAFGAAVVTLLSDEGRAKALGAAARERVAHRFLAPRHLVDQATLIGELLTKAN